MFLSKNSSHQTVQEPVNPLYLFSFEHGLTRLAGLSIEPVLVNEEMSRKVIYIFDGINRHYSRETADFWRHAFIYHHDLPSSVSLTTIRERCYQHHVELQAFVDAVNEYKRATLTQEYVEEKLDALKEAKKNLLLVVV